MENVFSDGTLGVPIACDPTRSFSSIPVNEDWSMTVEVIFVLDGILRCKKIWDSKEKIYFAKLIYPGTIGTPQDELLKEGEITIIHRVGDFSGAGNGDFELRTENQNGTSWVCFVTPRVIQIEDTSGEGNGREVYFDIFGAKQIPFWSETLSLKPIDPLSVFHENSPPYKNGRIYWGIKITGSPSYYLIFLSGFGDEAKQFIQTTGGKTYTLKVDGQGNILDFSVV